ncbi:MAG: hypothetical protein NW208_02685 [Bryobacter sp.]|nr:hypothetical protein [Bryobacter sp.]
MRKLVLIFAFLAAPNPFIFAETVSLNHTKFTNLPYVGPGPLRLAASGEGGNYFLSQPATPGAPWNLTTPNGPKAVPIPANMPVAMGDQHLVWVERSPLDTTLRYCVLPSCDHYQAERAELRGILTMKPIGPYVFTIHKDAMGIFLSRIELTSGKVTKLESLPEDQFAYRFGQCSTERIVLVDPSALRYKVFTPNQPSSSSYWTELRSDLADALKAKKPDFQTFGTAKVVPMHVRAHWLSAEGTDVFLLAKSQKGVGLYAIEVDGDGREAKRYLLRWPEGKSVNLSATFDLVTTNGDQVSFYMSGGAEATFRGLL